MELEHVNPCIKGTDLKGLHSIGLSGTGLTFIAFPIAMSQMDGSFFFALLFFVMFLCLGLGTQFATMEGIIAVLRDMDLGHGWSKPAFAAVVCGMFYVCGLVFVTRAGVYWVELFDVYAGIIGMFFCAGMECVAFMWCNSGGWAEFVSSVKTFTGITVGPLLRLLWMVVCPALLIALFILGLNTLDPMKALESKPFPEGAGYFPEWSICFGWFLAFLPLIVCVAAGIGGGCKAASCSASQPSNSYFQFRRSGTIRGTLVH
eukprot:UN4253